MRTSTDLASIHAARPAGAGGKFGRIPSWIVPLLLAFGVWINAFPARAASPFRLSTDRSIVSVGDAILVNFHMNIGTDVPSEFVYSYRIPQAAQYIPNSFLWDGAPLADSDPRLTITADEVRLTLPFLPGAPTNFDLSLRTTGSIGEPIHHRAVVGGLVPSTSLYARPTRIEDETATLLVAEFLADATLDEANVTWNHGAATQLELAGSDGGRKNAVLQFDLATLSDLLPIGWEVQAAYLELYPSVLIGSGELEGRPLRQKWTEGSMNGAPCVSGATWSSPNCIDSWSGGGESASKIDAVPVDTSTTYLELNITSYVIDKTTNLNPDYGIVLDISAGNIYLALSSLQAAEESILSPRLVIVVAPIGSYSQSAASRVIAEITPTQVIAGIPNVRFEYSLLPSISFDDTGINRLSISIPPNYTLTSVDSLLVGGISYSPGDGSPLKEREYENWGTSSRIDLRFSPTLTWLDLDPFIQVILHAIPPSVASSKRSFPSTVDHDRRGQPSLNAREGNANNSLGSGDNNKWSVAAIPSNLVRIDVTPVDTIVAVGFKVQYQAIAVYADGTYFDISTYATWTSAPDSLGSFDATGLFTTTTIGNSAIVASWNGVPSNSANLTVDPSELVSLSIVPSNQSIAFGDSAVFTAWGIFSNGDTFDLTASTTWTLSDSSIAQFASPGTAVGISPGNVQINASYSGIVAPPAFLTVTPAELVMITIIPADTSVALGFEVNLTAIGTYTDGSTGDLSAIVNWSAGPNGIIDIGVDGLVTTIAEGTATITASISELVSDPASFTVTSPILISLDGTPDNGAITILGFYSVQSWGTYSTGLVVNKTNFVTWTSLDPLVADFVTPGTVAALSAGTARLTHSFGLLQGDTLLVLVTSATIDSVRITPSALLLPPGASFPMTATSYWSDGSSQNVTSQATWTTDNAEVATIDSLGVTNARVDGTAFLAAEFGVPSNLCTLMVSTAAFDSLVISPTSNAIPIGLDAGFSALIYTNGSPLDITSSVMWNTGNTAIATVDSVGLVTGRTIGSTTVQASFDTLIATPANVQVTAAVVTTVEVQPAHSTLRLGTGKQLTAIATYSEGLLVDVTASAGWVSSSPSVLFLQPDGLALGLSLGNALVTATFETVSSSASDLLVLPSVQLEALGIGSIPATPGTADAFLLSLRLTNNDVQTHELSALRVNISGPADSLRLWLDQGDGLFDPAVDFLVDAGTATNGRWAATNIGAILSVAGSQTIFLSADVSSTQSPHGTLLDASVVRASDLFWTSPTATVAPDGFPLNSFGEVVTQDLVLSQIQFIPQMADTVFPGSQEVVLLQLPLPDDGGLEDMLTDITVQHRGSAQFGVDIETIRMQQQQDAAPQTLPGSLKTAPVSPGHLSAVWQDVTNLAHTGGGQWVASGISVPIGLNASTQIRLVASLATSAQEGKTLQLELPASGLTFSSGRSGPINSGWTNPASVLIEAQHQLTVSQTIVAPPANPISRDAGAQIVLGLELTALSANVDSLTRLRLLHVSTGPAGPAVDRDAQILSAQLWWDTDANGLIEGGVDELLDTQLPGAVVAGEIDFGATDPLKLELPIAQPMRLLVRLTPHPNLVRDAEFLGVLLNDALQIETSGDLEVLLPAPMQTLVPPQVNGQDAGGYDVRPLASTVLLPKDRDALVFDFTLPANGVDSDILSGLRLENSGTATASDISSVMLWRDDGNEIFDAADSLVALLPNIETRAWEATDILLPLLVNDPRRYWITVDISVNAQSSQTFQANIPLNGITVTSGNDGPIDASLVGGEAHVISEQNRVTWLAGIVGGSGGSGVQSVPPDANNQVILNIESFNGYPNIRTLTAIEVAVRGTASENEFQLWRLHSDENSNGLLDDSDVALAVASINNGLVNFRGFSWSLASQQQQRLLISYSLAFDLARDGSQVDAVIQSETAFEYTQKTLSIGSFELDSPSVDAIDGMIHKQITSFSVVPRSLGGGETDVLTLDLLLPSNGWQADTLDALQVQLATTPPAAIYGVDIIDVELWSESSASFVGAQFDPAEDVFLQRAVLNSGNLLFANLGATIPVGGQRFYVTVDVAINPTDGVRIQLRVPVNGINMRSGNDGPLDLGIDDIAVHTVSSSDLLASIEVAPLLVSRGQDVSLSVTVRNQGSSQADSVYVEQLLMNPPGSATLVSGPTPGFYSLAPQAEGIFQYVFSMNVPGDVTFTVVAAEWNGPRQSDAAQGPVIRVEEPPSALALTPLSSLPPSVNRGQIGVTPLIWQLVHPDTSSLAADISIDTVRLYVEDDAGVPQLASDIFASLEIRTGGLIHASWTNIPPDTLLTILFDAPVVLQAGESRDLPLTVSIASNAVASGFQIRLQGSAAISATDANSGAVVALNANLPWTTQSATILTPSTSIEVIANATLPATINQGQTGIPGGSLTFVLPGAPGESEVRLTELALRFEEAGVPRLAQDLFTRIRVRQGTTTLLDLQDMSSSTEELALPLSIPKVIASGDSVTLDLLFDLQSAIATSEVWVVMADSSAFEVRDSNSGAVVTAQLSNGSSYPWMQGPAIIQTPAQFLSTRATPMAPTGTFPAVQQMPVMDLMLTNIDPPGSASMQIESLAFELLDELGNLLIPTSVVTTARWRQGTTLVAQTSVANGLLMVLTPATALTLAPGDSFPIQLEVDLTANLSEPWVRFNFPGSGLMVTDANDPQQSIAATGLPTATNLIQIVAEASFVGLGAMDDPPSNVVPGTTAADLLPLRILHPGLENEADIQAQSLVIRVQDAYQQPLDTGSLVTAARITWDSLAVSAVIEGDSLTFDLSALPPIAATTFADLQLQMDIAAQVPVEDFRLLLATDALIANSGGGPALAVQTVGSLGLPYVSPTIHLSSGSLEESFSSYPNPFIPAQGMCNITFVLPSDSRVTCDIYTLSGNRVVQLLASTPLASGLHDDLTWDGRNERGETVRNGTYLLRIRVDGAGGGEFYRKLAVLR